jgi:hypothetical protein
LYSQNTKPPVRLRVDLVEHTDRVFVNGELSQITPDEISGIVEPVQLALITGNQPVFSWVIEDDRNNISQTSFRIQLSSSPLSNENKLIWDSGKITSGFSNFKYPENNLKPEITYYWRVKMWNNLGEESGWSATKIFRTGDELKDYSSTGYPLQQWDDTPVMSDYIRNDLLFIDFGKAAFSRMKITVDSKSRYDTLTIRIGEVLSGESRIDSDPGSARRFREVALPLMQGKHTYRIAIEKDDRNTRNHAIGMPEYIGDVLPFRYCEIEGSATITDITRESVSYLFNDYSSHFECSDTTLNAIWNFCKYSIKATSFAGIYVDGDRERIPYEADAYINQLSHYGVDDEYTLARRSMEYLLFNPTWPTEWIMTSVLMAWKDYEYTGNTDFLEKYYDDLKYKTLSALTDDNGLISTRTGKLTKEVYSSIHFNGGKLNDIVDWPHSGILGLSNDDSGETDGFVFTNYNTVVNAYHYKALVLMSRMADAIGKTEESKFYTQKAEEHKRAFNKLLFDTEKGYYNDGVDTNHSSLHSNIFALTFGLVPDKYVKSVVEFVRSRGMACSVYGSQHLLDALYMAESAGYGLELLTATGDRGWAHAIYDVGTTITLEAWDNKYKPNQDWNHAWGAAPANIIPIKLMGIEPLKPGFESIRIKPQIDTLKWAEIRYPSVKGEIVVNVKNTPGSYYSLKVMFPANSRDNQVWIPYVSNGRYKLTMNGDKIKAKKVRGFLVVDGIGSGSYNLMLNLKN